MAKVRDKLPPELEHVWEVLSDRCSKPGVKQTELARELGWDPAQLNRFLNHQQAWNSYEAVRAFVQLAPAVMAEALGLAAPSEADAPPPGSVQFPELDKAIQKRAQGQPFDQRAIAHARKLSRAMWADPGWPAWQELMDGYTAAHRDAWAESGSDAPASSSGVKTKGGTRVRRKKSREA